MPFKFDKDDNFLGFFADEDAWEEDAYQGPMNDWEYMTDDENVNHYHQEEDL